MTDPTSTVLTIAYNGAAFHGFARQPGLSTVQGTLEDALAVIARREISVAVAGRTDAGVHALANVVSYPSEPTDPETHEILRSLNALGGRDLVVSGVRHARRGFSARYDALAREYRYLLVPGATPPLAIGQRAWWTKGALDLSAMRAGAEQLIGTHDFRSFCVSGSADAAPTVRTIESIDIHPACEMGEHCIVLRIVGRSFLHSMVRIIAGTLVQVGKGRRDAAWVGEALAACHRGAAGITAPPHGLTLWHVTYADDYWL